MLAIVPSTCCDLLSPYSSVTQSMTYSLISSHIFTCLMASTGRSVGAARVSKGHFRVPRDFRGQHNGGGSPQTTVGALFPPCHIHCYIVPVQIKMDPFAIGMRWNLSRLGPKPGNRRDILASILACELEPRDASPTDQIKCYLCPWTQCYLCLCG